MLVSPIPGRKYPLHKVETHRNPSKNTTGSKKVPPLPLGVALNRISGLR